ncbi:SufD family Fe-S cluster assembly protein [uncultured Selenomonas sp.]|uniref:SufB/SufD family protein n=2 Tax=uncultured Selenomonas sp. TaxID=159275 RepID=UPI0028DBA801|nr:SufD family Fe-S cluster assembly protein [uncultured Selenomonas sp.]
MQNQEIFSSIPMRTWRWLGVNGAVLPEGLAGVETSDIHVEAGEKKEAVYVYRAGGRAEIKAHIEKGAALSLVKVQLVPETESHADDIEVHVEEDGSFSCTIIEVGAKELVSKITVELQGANAAADIASFYFADKNRKFDFNYLVRQRGVHTDANMYVKGALMDEAQKVFRGTLDFIAGSAGSVGRENEDVILLSPGVRNRSVPLMLSGEGDVDGHHAVSIGKMDEAKLFYLMSRGLDLAEARRLVVEADLFPVLSRLSDEALKEEVAASIEGRIEDAQ